MKSKTYAISLTVMASLLWGTSFVVNKIGLSYVDAYTFSFLRLLIASIAVIVVAIPMRRVQVSLFKNRTVWALGIFNAAGFILQYVGMTYTTASKSSLLVDSDVIVVALLSWLIFKEHFSNPKKAAVAMGFLGAALLATSGNLNELLGGELMGDILVFLAGVSWAFFMVCNKAMVSKGTDIVAMTVSVEVLTSVFLLPFTILLGTTSVTAIPALGWATLVFTGVFCSTVAYFLFTLGLKGLTVTTSAIVLLLEVLWALLLSFTLLGESFTSLAAIGAALILVSILLASK
ncbi:MAG: EamA family transporter [Candidatus Atabeyarchaeum deiterrae]